MYRKIFFLFALAMLHRADCRDLDIFQIISARDYKLLEAITNNAESVNSRNNNGYTPLMAAARQGDVEMVKMLIEAGADLDAQDNGFTAENQVESYIRRVCNKDDNVSSMRRMGFKENIIQSYVKEVESLAGTPELIKAWKEILQEIRDHNRRGINDSADECVGSTDFCNQICINTNTLNITDLKQVLPVLRVHDKQLMVAVKAKGRRAFVLVDGKVAQDTGGGKIINIRHGESAKIIFPDSMVHLKPVEGFEPTESVPLMFSVELKSVCQGQCGCAIEVKKGVLGASKNINDEYCVFVK